MKAYNPYSLIGKTILVTGASSGIGQSVAVECSKLGATVIITGRDEGRLNHTYSLLEGEGHLQFTVDLSIYEDIERLIDFCPPLDGLSNNAGISKILFVKFIQSKHLNEIMQTNAYAPILLLQLLVRNKKLKHPSSVVFTSSLSGIYNVHYGDSLNAASKGALNGFAKGAALDLASQLIRVNCVNPGVIFTGTEKNMILSEDELREKEKFFPMKRFGKPEDIAFGIIFLLSDASTWITGDDLVIDGGYTLL
jgi:NAD(P)-dependent dehydrogenase (short-subunit alcohol dehydrogenase family)